MNDTLIFEIAFQWMIWFVVYYLFLRKQTFFNANRFYLLGTLVLSILIPQIRSLMVIAPEMQLVVNIPEMVIRPENFATESTSYISVTHWLLTVYYVGVMFFLGRFLVSVVRLWQNVRHLRKQKDGRYWIVELPKGSAPFSFFNYVFVAPRTTYKEVEWDQIIAHEKCHGRYFHSLDILVVEIIKIIFWWNPLVYLYQHALQDVHEFQADNATTQRFDKKEYSRLLYRQTQSGMQVALTSYFVHSQLKKRIKMMMKKKSKPTQLLRYGLVLPLMVLLFLVNGQGPQPLVSNANIDLSASVEQDTIYKKVSKMPRFEGCWGETPGKGELDKCSQKAMLTFIYTNIHYPKEGRVKGQSAKVIASFVVNSKGRVDDIKILRKAGYGFDEEVMAVLKKMADEKEWKPGEDHGVAVSVRYTLPIVFRLE